MFHSVAEAWYSASKNNMADVRELIPEFFYLPGMYDVSNIKNQIWVIQGVKNSPKMGIGKAPSIGARRQLKADLS